jgi:hypothetical protein
MKRLAKLNERQVLIAHAEAMRQEALAYQVEHDGEDDSYNAMVGEIDCMVELMILRKIEE